MISHIKNFRMNFTIWIIFLGCIVSSLGQSANQSCDCGPYGTDCMYKDGVKDCTCRLGFKQNGEVCEACSCRRHYSDCNFVNGERNCTCDPGYIQKNEMCVEACSERRPCENGGECVNGICHCSEDLAGNFCQIIKQCEYENLCGEDPLSKCLYDVATKEAFCSCKIKDLTFVKDEKKCRAQCNTTSQCSFGGKCLEKEEGHFCQCKPTLLGDFCEIPTCEKNCFRGTSCKFMPELETSKCVCRESGTLPDFGEKLCKNSCHSDSDCKNGAKCGREDNGAKFCDCKRGTSGSFCEKLDYCYQCGNDYGVMCRYNMTEERVECLCDDAEKGYDGDRAKCRIPCDSNSECAQGSKCRHKASPFQDVKYEEKKFCGCLRGTRGDRCEIVDDCESRDCGDGDDVVCKYDTIRQISSCKCLGSLRDFDEKDKECKDCGCGPYTTSCYMHDKKKYCYCYTGYVQINDTCEACNCGEGSLNCGIYHETGEKICICERGYAQNGSTCQSCDCGRYSKNCGFKDGRKVCDCPENYTEYNGTCVFLD